MAVTLLGTDRNVHTRLSAVSPSEDVASAKWKLGDNLPSGDPIATGSLAVGPGFTGSMDLTLVRPDDSVGDSSVKVYRSYMDRDGNVLSTFASSALTVDITPATHTMALSAAPANTASCEIGLLSDMTPPGDVVRTNIYPDPACTATTRWEARNSWTLGVGAGASGLPGGVTSYVYAQCVSAGAAASSGLNLHGSPLSASPPTTGGLPVTAGDVITLSAYVYTAKAGTVYWEVRGFAGTSWVGSTVTATLAVSAATWTRISQTFTVPAGATSLAGALRIPTSTTWAVADQFRVSCVLVEIAASVADYFDGSHIASAISSPKSSRWAGVTDNSWSLLYAATNPGGTIVQATDSVLTYSGEAVEIVGCALERDYRRSVADIFNAEESLITAGTAGLLSGSITYLCESLAQGRALDAVYRLSGLITLDTDDELDGLTHRAVGKARLNPEKALPGKAAKCLLQIEFREQVR